MEECDLVEMGLVIESGVAWSGFVVVAAEEKKIGEEKIRVF